MNSSTLITMFVACLVSVACQQTPAPRYGSSAAEPAYAERYPSALNAARAGYLEDEKLVREKSTEFSALPGELKSPDWKEVGNVIELADSAGKNADYAEGATEARRVTRFYAEEKQGLVQKLGGSVNYAAKEKQCDVDFYGTVAGSLDRSMEKVIEERLRSHNAAHRYIEDHVDALGESNVPKLSKRADEIAMASFLVNVHLPSAKQDLDALLADASNVKDTLERQQTEAQAVLTNPKASAAAKKVAKQRAEAASTARMGLDGAISGAEQSSKELEQRTAQLQADYQKALDALKEAVAREAENSPTPD
jgi:hypothetical protein